MPHADGPYRARTMDSGATMPYYIIPFDAKGGCAGPRSRAHLCEAVDGDRFTDLFLFAHGWNNDWETATARYDSFMEGFTRLQTECGLPMPEPYRPILVGIFWPSTALVFGEAEVGPVIAAAGGASPPDETFGVDEIIQSVAPADRERARSLLAEPRLDDSEALVLARLVQANFAAPDDEIGAGPIDAAEAIVALWRAQSMDDPYGGDIGTVGTVTNVPPAAAGLPGWLDPRPLLRLLTVWRMKDRAGLVGAHGVQPLLRDLLEATTQTRIHLLGHSYGGKVVLSAVGHDGPLPRRAHSMLLLQPAVSHLCFAERIPGTDTPGGYHAVLDRVEQPILTTFSARDKPLHDTFHLVLRRSRDVAEVAFASVGEPPSAYAALGGYGPRGAGEQLVMMERPPVRYEFEDGVRVYGLNGSQIIRDHGDVSNVGTWWALYNQITAPGAIGGVT